jgi:hypothetical protein
MTTGKIQNPNTTKSQINPPAFSGTLNPKVNLELGNWEIW